MASIPLRPHRALVHPLWLGALVVLATNDHWWKFADLLPAPITGKLSDVAGMLVAPVLLAALVGVRRRSGLWAAHAAVGVVFTMIQLSRPFADLWSALMGSVGMPWIITCDPTDLIALPALVLGMRVFPRAMQRHAVHGLRRTGEVTGAGVGLFCCVATSRPNEEIDPFVPELDADVYVVNDTDEDLVVRIRQLAPDVELDCDIVADDPGRLLSSTLFGTVQSWTVAAGTNVAVRDDVSTSAPCYAALIDADGWSPRVAFWRDGNPTRTSVSGEGVDDNAPGWIRMTDGDDGGAYEAGLDILFAPVADEGPNGGACGAQDDGERTEWGGVIPHGHWSIAAIEPGLDGCTGFGLADVGSGVESLRWYVCTPQLELPFAVGDAIAVDPFADVSIEGMTIRAIDPQTYTPTVPVRELVVSRGSEPASIVDLDTTFVPTFDCQQTVDECGTVARPGKLVVGGPGWPSAEIAVSDRVAIEQTGGARIEIAMAHGQDRDVVNTACALGPAGLGPDVEIAATYVGAAE